MTHSSLSSVKIELDKEDSQMGYLRILSHLTAMDKQFIPILSDRVNLSEYSKKIHKYAIRIYARYDEYDIGHCYFYINESRCAYITSFGVMQENREAGIATQIMEKVKQVCIRSKIKEIELKVSTQNIPAVSFYRKQGFIDTDIQPPWIIMKCILS